MNEAPLIGAPRATRRSLSHRLRVLFVVLATGCGCDAENCSDLFELRFDPSDTAPSHVRITIDGAEYEGACPGPLATEDRVSATTAYCEVDKLTVRFDGEDGRDDRVLSGVAVITREGGRTSNVPFAPTSPESFDEGCSTCFLYTSPESAR